MESFILLSFPPRLGIICSLGVGGGGGGLRGEGAEGSVSSRENGCFGRRRKMKRVIW